MASIQIKFNDKTFALEYNRKAIIKMEEQGFDVNKVEAQPLKMMSILIYGAFTKNHPELSNEEIDEIVEQISDLDKFIEALVKLYQEALLVLTKGTDKGNASWGMN